MSVGDPWPLLRRGVRVHFPVCFPRGKGVPGHDRDLGHAGDLRVLRHRVLCKFVICPLCSARDEWEKSGGNSGEGAVVSAAVVVAHECLE